VLAGLFVEILEEGDCFGDLGMEMKIILQQIIKGKSARTWVQFTRFL
jgi:hypothetical protein